LILLKTGLDRLYSSHVNNIVQNVPVELWMKILSNNPSDPAFLEKSVLKINSVVHERSLSWHGIG